MWTEAYLDTHPWARSVLLKDIRTKAMANGRCLQPDHHMYSVHQDPGPTHKMSRVCLCFKYALRYLRLASGDELVFMVCLMAVRCLTVHQGPTVRWMNNKEC